MQADEEVGKIAQAVPVIISRTLELFVESLLTKSSSITSSRNAKTLSPSHLKQCKYPKRREVLPWSHNQLHPFILGIMSESRFDFLKDLVKTVPDIADIEGNTTVEDHHSDGSVPSSSELTEPSIRLQCNKCFIF